MGTTYHINKHSIHLYGQDNAKKLNRLTVDDLVRLALMNSIPLKKVLVNALNKKDWK